MKKSDHTPKGHPQSYYRDTDPYKDFMNPEKGLGRKNKSEARGKALERKKNKFKTLDNEEAYRKGEKTLGKLTEGIRKGYM